MVYSSLRRASRWPSAHRIVSTAFCPSSDRCFDMRAILDQDGVMTLRVVLVRTHNPGNIGAAARAAKNFGAEIALLGPRTDPAPPDAISFASGAEELLGRVSVLSAWRG